MDTVYRSQWFPCRLHRSYSKPSRAPTHSHTTRSSVALRKMVLSGLEIHMLAAHTCLRLGSACTLLLHPSAHSAIWPPSNSSLHSSRKHTQKQSEKERRNHNALCNLRSQRSSLREEPAVSFQYRPALETTRSHETTRTPEFTNPSHLVNSSRTCPLHST